MTETPSGVSIETPRTDLEDPGERVQLLNEWLADYPNRSPIEQGLIDQAIDALIARRCMERVRATVRAEKVRTADLFWERTQQDIVARYLRQFGTHAPSALVGLLRSAMGCRWAIAFLERLQKSLVQDRTWVGFDKIGAIQIQGFSASIEDLRHSEAAYITWIDCLAAQANPKQRDIDLILDPAYVPKSLQDRDVPLWPRDPVECRARLQAMLDRELPRIKALEADLRVKYEDPSRAEARTMALAIVCKEEMQLLRAQRIHEQSYLQAVTALLKFRKSTAASRGPGAGRVLDESPLVVQPFAAPPRVPDPTRPRGDGPVVVRSEHRCLSGASFRKGPIPNKAVESQLPGGAKGSDEFRRIGQPPGQEPRTREAPDRRPAPFHGKDPIPNKAVESQVPDGAKGSVEIRPTGDAWAAWSREPTKRTTSGAGWPGRHRPNSKQSRGT